MDQAIAGIRERRCNFKLRRLINCTSGLSLLCCAAHAAPAKAADWLSNAFVQDDDRIEVRAPARSPRLVFLGLDTWNASSDDLREFLHSPLHAREPARGSFLRAVDALALDDLHYKSHPIKRIKNGLGFDYFLESGGAVHFNLYERRGRGHDAVRVALNPVDDAVRQAQRHRNWSVGVSTDFVRTVDGDRSVRFKPQLLLDLDGLLKLDKARIEACVEYGHWYGGGRKAVADVQVAQARIRLRF